MAAIFQQVTEGVSVTVECFFQPAQSNPIKNEYLFAYRVTIENLSARPVKLLRRHWHIIEGTGNYREVEGEGVVGLQPVISPGGSHQYVSACSLHSDMGKMYGTFQMENLFDNRLIRVNIPEFQMVAPFKLN